MRPRLAALAVAAGLAVAACGGGDAGPTASEATTTGDPANPVPDFLAFTADDVRGGDPIDASVYAGSDLVLWFWAPW